MVETSALEAYITNTFTKIVDQYNRPLNISLAAPTLFNIISGNTEQYANHRYDHIGEIITTCVINLVITKQYPSFSNEALTALGKKFTSLTRLHKVINQEIHLKDFVLGPYLSKTLNSIIGVLFSYYGIDVIEKFIKSAVIHTAGLELHEVMPAKPKEQMTNPIYLLQQTVNSGKGHFDTSATPLNGMWCVKIMCKLTEQSTVFSHSCNAPSKQKAKTEAAQDIMTLFAKNPALFEQLKAPATGPEEFVLPITPDDFCQVSNATSRQSSTSSMNPSEWSDINVNPHISAEDNEETLQRLSELLLGGQQTESDGNNKKRPRQNMFSSPVDQPVSYIKQEDECKPFNRTPDEVNDGTITFFKQYFDKNRSLLTTCKINPGQSKSILLSLVVPQQDVLHVDVKTSQAGNSHQPLFHAEVILKSKVKTNLFLKTEGLATKKRDAEQAAFKKLVDLITQQ